MPLAKTLKLGKREIKRWKSRLQEAIASEKERHPSQERLINLYQGKMGGQDSHLSADDLWVEVNKFAPVVDTKKDQLFFATPTIQVTADEVLKDAFAEQAPSVAHAIESLVNKLLGRNGIDVKPQIRKAIFDVLCTSGLGCCEIGYRTSTVPTTFKAGEQNPLEPTIQAMDPMTGEYTEQPNVLEEDLTVEVPVHEEFFWDFFSRKQLLKPKDFLDTNFDKASWLAVKFSIPRANAPAAWKLPKDFKPTGLPEDFSFNTTKRTMATDTETIHGIRIWAKAAHFDKKIMNPDLYMKIVFINGIDDPVELKLSPHQSVDETGRLTPNSQRGNPIHILSLRDVTDSADPPSDCALIEPLTREKSKGRSQMLTHRDRSIPMNWHDRNRVSDADIAKWEQGEIGSSIPVDGNGSEIFGEIPRASMKSENFQFDQVVDKDISEIARVSINQTGGLTDEKKSATEVSTVQQNSQIGVDSDRLQVMEWFLTGLEKKFIPLVQRYGDPQLFARYVGQENAQLLMQWVTSETVPGLALEVLPDSGAHIDAQVMLDMLLREYEFFAKDPNFNRVPMMRKAIGLSGLNPQESVVDELPEAKPQPPNISARVSGDDLSPIMPQFAVIKEVLEQLGVKISDEAVQRGMATNDAMLIAQALMGAQAPAQGSPDTQHGGLAPKAEILSKREADVGGDPSRAIQGLPEDLQ